MSRSLPTTTSTRSTVSRPRFARPCNRRLPASICVSTPRRRYRSRPTPIWLCDPSASDSVLHGDADLSPALAGVPEACARRSHRSGASDDTWSDRPRGALRRLAASSAADRQLSHRPGGIRDAPERIELARCVDARIHAVAVRSMRPRPGALGAHASVAHLGEVEPGSD